MFARTLGLIVLVFPSTLAAVFIAVSDTVAPGVGRRTQPPLMHAWFRVLAGLFGLRIRIAGTPSPSPALVACNHLSWVDIVALGASVRGAFVSKAEIDRWPLIGYFARHGGRTLFIDRGELRSFRNLGGQLVARLRAGQRVIFFPEGTVGTPAAPLPFKPRLFAAAAMAECQVQPVALAYTGGDGAERAPMGDADVFMTHLLRLLSCRRTEVTLVFLDPVAAGDAEPKAVAARVRAAVTGALPASGNTA